MDIHVDWFTGTFVGGDYHGESGINVVMTNFLPFLPLSAFILCDKGANGYNIRYTIDNSITVLAASDACDPVHRMGVCIMFSGRGLALLESWGVPVNDFICSLYGVEGFRVTRLDIACDVRSRDELDIERVFACVPKQPSDARNFVSKWRSGRFVGSFSNVLGRTLYMGSRSSDSLVRFYDKAVEQKLLNGSYWFRVELELHRIPANSFLDKWFGSSLPLGDVFRGCLADRLMFGEGDNNAHKFTPFDWWTKFLDGCQKVTLSTRLSAGDSSLARTANWAYNALSRLLFKCVAAFGGDIVSDWLRVGFRKMRIQDWQQVCLERGNNPSSFKIPSVLKTGSECNWMDISFGFKALFDRGKNPDYKPFGFGQTEMGCFA